MSTRDFFDLFKINILKNSKIYLGLLFWLLLFAYVISFVPSHLPLGILRFLSIIQSYIPNRDSWIIPYGVLFFLAWVLTFILLNELFERLLDFFKRGRTYDFTEKSWFEDWIYNGRPKLVYNPTRLQVNSSRSGCLLKKSLWKNFEMNFKMRYFVQTPFVDRSYSKNLGIIFRAKDLENYLMLQIRNIENRLSVRAHVRYEGMWEVTSDEDLGKISSSSVWLDVKLIANKRKINLEIDNVGSYEWFLPTHVDINLIEEGVRKKTNKLSEEEYGPVKPFLPQISYVESFGMIGFRAHVNEGADIKDITIRAI